MLRRTKPAIPHSPVRDLISFVLLAVSVFLLLSVVSYNRLDPSWNTFVQGDQVFVHNYCGIVGSYVADFLMQIFGYACYLVPLAMFGVTWSVVFRPTWQGVYARVVGFALFLLAGSLFCSLVEGKDPKLFPWGGLIGHVLGVHLENYLGRVGAYLVGATLLAISLVLTVRFTFRGIVHRLHRLGYFFAHFGTMTYPLVQAISVRLRRFLELGERDIERGMEAIRKDVALKLPEKIKIAGKEVSPDRLPEKLPAPLELEPKATVASEEIPIVIQREKRKPQAMPSFHSLGEIQDEIEEKGKKEKREKIHYRLPGITLLEAPEDQELLINRDELFQNAQTLERKLKDFGVFGKVVEVQPGPVVTMYEFEPAAGVKVNQITRLNDDLALALKALSVRITLMPGKAVIGIEVANRERMVVYLKDVVASQTFSAASSSLALAIGKDIAGSPFTTDLRKMPHLLVAGATGSGKSVSVNTMILSVLYRSTPEDVRMILVDPKMLELSLYDHIPHLLLPVVTDPRKAAAALRWAVIEMERRYRLMADLGVRNIDGYNKKIRKYLNEEVQKKEDEAELPLDPLSASNQAREQDEHTGKLPLIMIVIDELADLMMVSSREVEESIIRLAQMARAAGIHLLLATQRPSVDVITGVIKANMPARISFQVSSKVDSRTILDANGAELLLGAGDMLFLPPGTSKLLRIHGAFVTDAEVKRVTDFWKEQGTPDYDHNILRIQEEQAQLANGQGEDDDMYAQALRLVRTHRVASISMIQRKLRIGYNRAARLVERMDEEGLLTPGEAGKPREVRVTMLDG